MKTQQKVATLAATLITFGSLTGGANAASILSSFGTASGSGTSTTSTRGFEFNTTSDFLVTHLSFYDEGGDGLADSHTIGLWDSSGTLLASDTISSGTTAPLTEGVWRLVDIVDFVLPAATGYVVGATFERGSADLQFNTVPTTIADVEWVEGRFITNGVSALTLPTSGLSVGLSGGSIEVSAVPEPSSSLLLGLGALGLVARRKRTA